MIAHYLLISAALFAVGAYGVMVRRNLVMVLLSIEVMLNGAALSFVAFARGGTLAIATPSIEGHIYVILVLAIAAAEAAVGLAILILLFRNRRAVHTGAAASLWG